MKDTVNKKGFTLTEVLAVIALIGILLIFIMPRLTDIFSNSVGSTMKIQENEIKDAGLLYLEDFCKNRINNNICPGTITRNKETNKYSGYVLLETLENEKYIEDVSLRSEDCKGCVIYEENKANSYLVCGNKYETETTVDFKSICKIN